MARWSIPTIFVSLLIRTRAAWGLCIYYLGGSQWSEIVNVLTQWCITFVDINETVPVTLSTTRSTGQLPRANCIITDHFEMSFERPVNVWTLDNDFRTSYSTWSSKYEIFFSSDGANSEINRYKSWGVGRPVMVNSLDRSRCRQPFNVRFNFPFRAELEITSLTAVTRLSPIQLQLTVTIEEGTRMRGNGASIDKRSRRSTTSWRS